MSRVTLDADLKAKFDGMREQTELCGPDGRTMGRYLPEAVYQKLLYQIAEAQCPPLTAEEMERRRNPTGFKTLAEILAKMEAS